MKLIFRNKIFLFSLSLLIFVSCGIDKYYWLPQMPEGSASAFSVSVNLPSLSNDFFYARDFKIYYKIYLSNILDDSTINPDSYNLINLRIATDYNAFVNFVNSTTTNIPTPADFSSRNFFELQFEDPGLLSITLGTPPRNLTIDFHAFEPAEIFIDNVSKGNILRNSISGFQLEPDNLIFSTDELRDNVFAGAGANNIDSDINRDVFPVQGETGRIAEHAYISMYILIAGTNEETFQTIFGKPIHLGVFKIRP